MVFNDTINSTGLCQEIDALCDTTTTSYPVADKTRRVNTAYETVVGDLINADGTWQFDDTNYTDLPIATQTLLADQQDYSFSSAHLDIERVEVKAATGIWYMLTPIDKSEVDVALSEFYKTSGLPLFYDKQGGSLFLYPAPAAASVTLTAGLKVYFKRTASLFDPADTSKQPGFASPFHIILAYMAALPYCAAYKKDRVALYSNEVVRLRQELLAFYGRREKDVRKKITMKGIIYK